MTPFRANSAGYLAQWDAVERSIIAEVARGIAELLRIQTGLDLPASQLGDEMPSRYPGVDQVESAGLEAIDLPLIGARRQIDDPAVQRLLPDAAADPIIAGEFRHLTQSELATTKAQNLTELAELLVGTDRTGAQDAVFIPRAKAPQAAAALTDVRLVLGERLGIKSDDDAERVIDDLLEGRTAEQQSLWASVFAASGYAQETLVQAMLDDFRKRAAKSPER